MILYSEGGTKSQEDEAEVILSALTTAYPNYPWAVRVYDGGFFIRNLMYPQGWGMNCKYPEFDYSASQMKRVIILKAGEFLERANLRRGFNVNDDEPAYVEGIPLNEQLPSEKPAVTAETVVVAPPDAMRETPRPQVLKEMNDG